ncbi:DUF6875 domain-containing protein [Streptomyces syringium]|uniref:DUF6875 domain-containing protein n=1 Tax=Streptomyces syringium TaxID=76729 RepID=UPI00343B5F6E
MSPEPDPEPPAEEPFPADPGAVRRGELVRPAPVVFRDGDSDDDGDDGDGGTELGAVFRPYLRDYIGDSIGRAGPSNAICPFVRGALRAGVMHYAELRVAGHTAPRAVARALVGYLAWFDRASQRESPEHPGLVVAFPGPAAPLLPVVAAAHRAVLPAVYARGCTAALFHEDPAEPDDAHHPEPRYFTAPAPFYVLRRIIPADLQLSLRVRQMFPAYHRLHAAEARRSRLRTKEAAERWNQACREHGLTP